MLKLDNNLLEELGLGSLPDAQKRQMLQHIYDTLELRVGTQLANQMTDKQLEEFEKFIDAGGDANQAQALQWLEANLPNYKDVVQQTFDTLKVEVKGMAPQLLASAAQQPQEAQIVSPQPSPSSQPPSSSYAPQPAPQYGMPPAQAPAPSPQQVVPSQQAPTDASQPWQQPQAPFQQPMTPPSPSQPMYQPQSYVSVSQSAPQQDLPGSSNSFASQPTQNPQVPTDSSQQFVPPASSTSSQTAPMWQPQPPVQPWQPTPPPDQQPPQAS